MYMTINEYKSPDYSISYDLQHDILRLNNKPIANFSYEDYRDNFYFMVDEDTKEIIGAQIINFLAKRKHTVTIIEELEYTHLKKALVNSLYIVESNLK